MTFSALVLQKLAPSTLQAVGRQQPRPVALRWAVLQPNEGAKAAALGACLCETGSQGRLRLEASTKRGPQHPAPVDQQCLRGWRTTEAEPIASAVTVQLGHLRDTGKGPVGLEMDFSSASAQGTLCLPFFLPPKNTYLG